MLEDIKKSYIKTAKSVVPNWQNIDVNTLCNLYIQNENDKIKKDAYFAAIMLKKWGYIGRHYINSRSSGFSIEECYDMVVDALLYILKARKWLDRSNKLYRDKNAPDKCLNRAIYSSRQLYYYLSNRDKRKGNYAKISLDKAAEIVSDHLEIVGTVCDEPISSDNISHTVFLRSIVIDKLEKNKLIEALILDNILNDDCFVYSKKKDSTKEIKLNFKLGKLVNNIYSYCAYDLQNISKKYNFNEDKLLPILPILKKDKNKLSRIIKASLSAMSEDMELKENLCY
jgi:hypothetical protein